MIAEPGFDPQTTVLWSQRASTPPDHGNLRQWTTITTTTTISAFKHSVRSPAKRAITNILIISFSVFYVGYPIYTAGWTVGATETNFTVKICPVAGVEPTPFLTPKKLWTFQIKGR